MLAETSKQQRQMAILASMISKEKLTVALVHGDIYVNSGEILRNISIKGESKLGDVQLLNKERTSYKNGRADTEFNLSSEFGDITVDTPDDDNQ